ncbi:unnamed protein product [Caenorhabditis bovis]|uniref:Uncharacterized protein n=1 Tax=Caenorhabditis bovis TaxID=2654633 RepID=A0A8S1E382_9PELO|nr:unnamed protein product [Caenorhabditis bovis]
MSLGIRTLVVVFCLVVVCFAFGRLELQDHMQFSRFHEPVSSNGGSSGNAADDAYIRYLSEYFGRPAQRRASAP